jgi:thiosulfate dehydrogenase (quinone) large subunit
MVDIGNEHNGAVSGAAHATTMPLRPVEQHVRRQAATRTTPPTSYAPAAERGLVTVGSWPAAAIRYLLATIRLALGWLFLWAFMDKTFGLGHDTTVAKSWLNGNSPTKDFLGSAAKGPFAGFYHSIAGVPVTDVLLMAALLGVGTTLILGIGMRLAAGGGTLLTVVTWTAVLPPAGNPFMDQHLIYAAALIALPLLGAGNTLGLGRFWSARPLVRRTPWLQ